LSYESKPIEKWNVNDFLKYFGDKHEERFGIEYLPMGSWAAERGQVANMIGTAKKPGKYKKSVFKRFLDECLAEYKPSRDYPGVSIGWLITYRKQLLQRIVADESRRKVDEEKQSKPIDPGISEWFLS
jgi:hypothetical protein